MVSKRLLFNAGKNAIITVPMGYKELELEIIRESAINSGINEKQLTIQTMDKLVSSDPELAEKIYFIIDLDDHEQSIILKKGIFTIEYLRKTVVATICNQMFSIAIEKISQILQTSEGDILDDEDLVDKLNTDMNYNKKRLYSGEYTRGTLHYNGKRLVYPLYEADLEKASVQYVSSLMTGIEFCLTETGISLSKIFKIVITGCESKNPFVKSALSNKFNKIVFEESSNNILDALSDSEHKS